MNTPNKQTNKQKCRNSFGLYRPRFGHSVIFCKWGKHENACSNSANLPLDQPRRGLSRLTATPVPGNQPTFQRGSGLHIYVFLLCDHVCTLDKYCWNEDTRRAVRRKPGLCHTNYCNKLKFADQFFYCSSVAHSTQVMSNAKGLLGSSYHYLTRNTKVIAMVLILKMVELLHLEPRLPVSQLSLLTDFKKLRYLASNSDISSN